MTSSPATGFAKFSKGKPHPEQIVLLVNSILDNFLVLRLSRVFDSMYPLQKLFVVSLNVSSGV